MMDIVLLRILKFLNGCLNNDYMYKISIFIVRHYIDMEEYDLTRLMKEEQVLDFCKHLSFHSYEEFQQQLISDYMSRVNQIWACL